MPETANRTPVSFYFKAYDADTSRLLGGGHYDAFIDPEAAYQAAEQHFSRVYPGVEVHIEEITQDEYDGGQS